MDYMAKFVENIIIQRNKAVESKIAIEIREIACENGLETQVDLYEENIISALKKQIPQRPIRERFMMFCPACEEPFDCPERTNYCSNCGQKIRLE